MQTRKYPRTMQEAFGPYTSRDLCDPREDFKWTPVRIALAVTYAASLVALVVVMLP